MDADEVVVESNEPRSKWQKLTDIFERFPLSSQPQEFPGFLRGFQLTVVQLVQSVQLGGQRSHASTTDSTCTDSCPPPDENEIEKAYIDPTVFVRSWRSLPMNGYLLDNSYWNDTFGTLTFP